MTTFPLRTKTLYPTFSLDTENPASWWHIFYLITSPFMTVSWLGWWSICSTEHEETDPNPSSISNHQGGLGQVTSPLWTSVSSVFWDEYFLLCLPGWDVGKIQWEDDCKNVLKWWCYSRGSMVSLLGKFLVSSLWGSLCCCTQMCPRNLAPKVLRMVPEA